MLHFLSGRLTTGDFPIALYQPKQGFLLYPFLAFFQLLCYTFFDLNTKSKLYQRKKPPLQAQKEAHMDLFKTHEILPFPFFDFIPALDRLVIGIHFNTKDNTEHVLIGESAGVIRFLMSPTVESENALLASSKRPLGTLVSELCSTNPPIPEEGALDFRVPRSIPALANSIKASLSLLCSCASSNTSSLPSLESLSELLLLAYNSNNLALRFTVLRAVQEYRACVSSQKADDQKRLSNMNSASQKGHAKEDFQSSETIEDIFMPMTYSHAEELKNIKDLAGDYGRGAVKFIPGVLADTYRFVLDHPAQIMYAHDSEFSEYLVSDFSVLPLYTDYLRAIYGKDQTLVRCKLCGRLYPSESNRRGFCSDACAKEQKRFIKKDFRKSHKDDPFESPHHNGYEYFRKKVKKCEAAGLPEDELNMILNAFQDFVKENLARKEQAKEIVEQGGDINEAFNSYQNWVFEQENAFDTCVRRLESAP